VNVRYWRVNERTGAWGLRLLGLSLDPSLFVQANEDAPSVHVSVTVERYTPRPFQLNASFAEIDLVGRGRVRMDRQARTSELIMSALPTPDEIVHPLLASTAVIMSHWLGRVTLHAGAVLIGGGAWALLGDRTGGKSTTLACLDRRGMSALTDDVLVVDNGLAFSGPRCVDLREEAAHKLGIGRDIGGTGTRERWRVTLGDVAPDYPLRGVVFMEWGDEAAMVRVPVREVLPRLFHHLALPYEPNAEGILALAALPAWQWVRPTGWNSFDESMTTMVQRLET
jgi:hypothetical protein